ncbi:MULTISPECIES: porphobilinogen synthase [Flectobacillus]|jgi:porphobilinogen synthase|uniref:Delta-aminolevulinic acid dehydratase n=2 Tax=Flectobacillus TaxID=101 RepID=A0ABT6Z3R8_9BACT|nr:MULTISPECIES: porphobilinogen synthase [Flectobacillus]NBA74882.1 porphobilinogen synthase [Emticicia sp. ODNR4P]MDI9864651.1 porphobilinogen synthase [Flectobacillus longus]MDI9875761.1 porphobilinogen synthase [Flectobacillus rivi]MDI9880460.1 porphobilinogen synthase [Flectobacillus longus]PAC31916.1 delta-aminolevulinic acid dehydratase [Flectobacillus sp. BAB-3569]
MLRRPRRNRQSSAIRAMVEETTVSVNDLIYPMFVMEGQNLTTEVKSMPGIFRYSLDKLLDELAVIQDLGIRSIALFPQIPEAKKDKYATESHRQGNIYLESINAIKNAFPEICIMSDVAMDPYSADGHDGIVENGQILNDESLEVLAKMAVAQAEAGADIVGPSDMMDGRIGYIREALDDKGFINVGIMAYSAKYASAFYGPFRDALDSAPKFGDKKTYQMNPANIREALVEAELDYLEGADYLMVKPGLAYLDVIKTLNDNFNIPIAAYNVSGEYAMVKAAAQNGWLDGTRTMVECLTSLKRAGSKVILTYFAKEYAELVK